MKPWIKAGVLGGILQIIFTLPILLFYAFPAGIGAFFAVRVCCFFLLVYPVPGILVSHWLPSPRETGRLVRSVSPAGLLARGVIYTGMRKE